MVIVSNRWGLVMEMDISGADNGNLSFVCCLALADLAQARNDARKAEYYVSLAYAAMDRRYGQAPEIGASECKAAVMPAVADAFAA